jgi:hypothetical protein
MTKLMRFAVLLPLLALGACQTVPYQPYAREVKKKPGTGGLIALKTEHRDEDRAKAQSMMESNCGSKAVKITEEGEVVVGTSTTSNAKETNQAGTQGSQVGSFFGMPITSGASDPSKNTSTSATTTAVKEWNIAYDCGTATADAAPTDATPVASKTKKGKKKAAATVTE